MVIWPVWHRDLYDKQAALRTLRFVNFANRFAEFQVAPHVFNVIGGLKRRELFSHFDGLKLERHNSSALAMDLRLSCINPSILGPAIPFRAHYWSAYLGRKEPTQYTQRTDIYLSYWALVSGLYLLYTAMSISHADSYSFLQ